MAIMHPYTENNSESVWRALDAIAKSRVIKQDSIQYDLLKYLLTKNLAGEVDTLQPFSIGVDVMGKDSSFDPARDSRVRVEMYRLRRSLNSYYSVPRPGELKIEIPKGGYSTVFSELPKQEEADAEQQPGSLLQGKKGRHLNAVVFSIGLLGLAIFSIAKISAFFIYPSPLEDSVTPLVLILSKSDASNDTTDAVIKTLASNAATNWFLRISLDKKMEDEADYIINIDQVKNEQEQIHFELLNPDRQVIYANKLDLVESYDALARTIYNHLLLQTEGLILKHHFNRTELGNKQLTLFQCFMNVSTFLSPTTDSQNDVTDEMPKCLSPKFTTNPSDLRTIHGLRLSFFLKNLHSFKKPKINLENAQQELIEISKYDVSEIEILAYKIMLMAYDQTSDKESMRNLIANLELIDGYGNQTEYLILFFSTLHLADWEKANRLILTYRDMEVGPHKYGTFFNMVEQIRDGDFKDARITYNSSSMAGATLNVAMGLVIACAAQDQHFFNDILKEIHESAIFKRINFIEYVKFRNFEPKLTQVLLASLNRPNCPYKQSLREQIFKLSSDKPTNLNAI